MKKKVLIVLFSFLAVNLLHAQDIYFGPKVGLNVSHLMASGDDAEGFNDTSKMQFSSHFGVFAEVVFTDFFSLQPELLYSIKGSRFTHSDNDDYRNSHVYKYLSLPIIVKYYVTKEISIELGPEVAYLLSAREVEKDGFFSTFYGQEASSIDLKDDTQVFDFGATLGLGYLTKTGFYISLRYNYGLLNAFKTDLDVDTVLKNGTAQLSFGFSFQ